MYILYYRLLLIGTQLDTSKLLVGFHDRTVYVSVFHEHKPQLPILTSPYPELPSKKSTRQLRMTSLILTRAGLAVARLNRHVMVWDTEVFQLDIEARQACAPLLL